MAAAPVPSTPVGQAWSDDRRRVRRALAAGSGPAVSQPEDRFEREAERVADQLHAVPVARTPSPAADGSLPDDVRAALEPRFGRDLGAVRLHTDDRAATLAARLGARAFTVGADVHFASGEYRPSTAEGMRLLAHEVAHVLQQSGDIVRRQADDDAAVAEEQVLEGERGIDMTLGGVVAGAASGRPAISRVPPVIRIQRRCTKTPAQVGYPVTVDLAIPPTPAPDRSRTTAQISAMASDPNGTTAGITRFQAQLRWRMRFGRAGGTVWLTSFHATFRRPSLRIFLTRDFAAGSCELADLDRHERQHDADFRANVAESEMSICDTAGTWPARGQFEARLTIAELSGLIEDWLAYEQWQLNYDNWLDGCTWDTVDYPRMYQGCPGVVPAAPQARCGDAPKRPEPAHTLPLPQKP